MACYAYMHTVLVASVNISLYLLVFRCCLARQESRWQQDCGTSWNMVEAYMHLAKGVRAGAAVFEGQYRVEPGEVADHGGCGRG